MECRIFEEAGCEEGHISETSWERFRKVPEGSLGVGRGPVEMGK